MLIALALAAAAPAVAIPEGQALTDAIAARDADFFQLLFEGCDPARARAMLAVDFEMYHDKGGVVARSADGFIADYAKDCEARKRPDGWRSRRELVRTSLNVHPVPGYGAIEDGEHLFYERKGDGPEKLVGRARFTQLWALTPDGWRLARVFSYAHRPAG
ncbi:MAG TPA: nuclear transport factor 2 family protein [Allosphingosinicella sp.]|nr:nuclear transport factor 2 family protein [Allosphingosinicella sp.]